MAPLLDRSVRDAYLEIGDQKFPVPAGVPDGLDPGDFLLELLVQICRENVSAIDYKPIGYWEMMLELVRRTDQKEDERLLINLRRAIDFAQANPTPVQEALLRVQQKARVAYIDSWLRLTYALAESAIKAGDVVKAQVTVRWRGREGHFPGIKAAPRSA